MPDPVDGRCKVDARRWRRAMPVLLGCVVLLEGACSTPERPSGGAVLAASPEPYSVDVPVPVGFAFVGEVSEERASDGARYLRHRYEGRADKSAVRRFYREQMPLVRWSCVGDEAAHGRYTLRFTRGREACAIEISGGGVRTLGRIHVDVRITPTVERTSAP